MNGKLKVRLKLPKSLQHDSRSNDTATAQPSIKRKHPEEESASQTAQHQSSQVAYRSEGVQAAGNPPKKGKFVVKLGSAASGGPGNADFRSHGQPPIKPRLTIKLPIKAGNAGPTQSAQSSAATASKQAPSVPRVPGLHSTTQKKSPGSRQGPGLKGLNKKAGKGRPGGIQSLTHGTQPRLIHRVRDADRGPVAAAAQPTVVPDPIEIKPEPKSEAAPAAAAGPATNASGIIPTAGTKFVSINGRPDAPCTPAAVQRIIQKMQKKDTHGYFRDPVTDELAPGYSAVIKRPMDFKTMHARFEKGHYISWDALQDDLETIFTNAMTFNLPVTPYHKKAKILLGEAGRLLSLARQGVRDMRGSKPGPRPSSIVKEEAAEPGAPQQQGPPSQQGPEKRRGRLSKHAARAAKLAHRAGKPIRGSGPGRPPGSGVAGGLGGREAKAAPVYEEENLRAYYRTRTGPPAWQAWRGLALGATAEGVAYAAGKPVLCQVGGGAASVPSGEAYARSLARFAAGICGRARDAVLSRAAHVLSAPVAPAYVAPAPPPRVQQPTPTSAPSTAPAAAAAVAMRNVVPSSGGIPVGDAGSRNVWMAIPGMLPPGTLANLPPPPATGQPGASTAHGPALVGARGAFPTAASVLGSLPGTSGRPHLALAGLTSQFLSQVSQAGGQNFNTYLNALKQQQQQQQQQQPQPQQQQQQQLSQPAVSTSVAWPFASGRPPSTT